MRGAIMTDADSSFSPGLTSTVLGSVGMLLFFLPILGAPISGVGLILGAGGVLWAYFWQRGQSRWSVAGLIVCLVALTTNLAVAFGPIGLVPSYPVAQLWQPVPDRPYVPPPALPIG